MVISSPSDALTPGAFKMKSNATIVDKHRPELIVALFIFFNHITLFFLKWATYSFTLTDQFYSTLRGLRCDSFGIQIAHLPIHILISFRTKIVKTDNVWFFTVFPQTLGTDQEEWR
jgi:hypothetical protein